MYLIPPNFYASSLSHLSSLVVIIFNLLILQGLHCSDLSNVKKTSNAVKVVTPSPVVLRKAKLTTDSSWISASLNRHNYLRSLHNAQPLTLNTTLCEISQAWANHLLARSLENIRSNGNVAKDNFFFDHNHATNQKYFIGENLYFSTHSRGVQVNGTIAVTLWYNEIKDYDFQFARVKVTSRAESLIGHFTQLVWKSSTDMGTAFATGQLPNGQLVTFIVANYYPAGNVLYRPDFPQKLYLKNVVPPVSDTENEIEDVDKVIQDKIQFWELSLVDITTPQAWIDQALNKHNEYRAHHDFPLLTESPKLSGLAQAWAEFLVAKGVRDFNSKWTIEGRHGFKNIAATEKAEFGENIIYLVGDGFVNPESVVTLWYEQHNFYDFENRRPNSNKSRTAQTNDFEQIMWKATTHFGMAFASGVAENGQVITFVVSYYYPRVPNWATLRDKMENLPDSSAHKIVVIPNIFIFLTSLGVLLTSQNVF
ncbi:uncharacterized protein LOC110859073 [Folsomia candida]|uniref:uncharacterized protein LOC110859073 n=1 Tax=Folsomia candida TaxID=158441 RepID=UPI000B900CA8|nr:uncharacterized protein LOC110859073 [Folsomia candida]